MQTPTTIGEALGEIRSISDRIDELNAELKACNERWSALESFLIEQGEAQGVRSFSDDGVSVSLASDLRVGYDPAKWESIVRFAVETGNFALIQRRLGEKVAKDLLDSGAEIPEGVTFTPYTKVSVRRK